jgi:hypothetical protein
LQKGEVMRFTNLDECVDADIKWTPSRGEAAQPPAAPVEPAYRRKSWFDSDPSADNPPVQRSSAGNGAAGDPIRWIKDTYLMWLKGDLDPAHMRRGQHFFRAQPQTAPVSAASDPVVGPNVQTVDFDDNSGADPAWHKIQDQIDEWAHQTLPPDHAAAIMSWSDRLAQHLTVTPTEPRGAEHRARRETQEAILSALLREARQYVSDAGSDEDGETQSHSTALLSAIDTALSRQTEGE